MELQFLSDKDFLALGPSPKLVYLIIKTAPEKMRPLHIEDLSLLSGFSIRVLYGIMKDINENFDPFTLIDSNEYIISE